MKIVARNVFIANLAVSDLCLCMVTMPLTLIEVKFYPLHCRLCAVILLSFFSIIWSLCRSLWLGCFFIILSPVWDDVHFDWGEDCSIILSPMCVELDGVLAGWTILLLHICRDTQHQASLFKVKRDNIRFWRHNEHKARLKTKTGCSVTSAPL